MGILGYFLQRHAPPSPFAANAGAGDASAIQSSPLRRLVSEQLGMLLLIICMCSFWPVGFYTVFVWFVEYESAVMDPPLPGSFWINGVLLAINIACTPLFGRLSDRHGRVRVMLGGLALSLMFPFCFWMRLSLPGGAKPIISLLSGVTMSVSLAAFSGPLPAFMVEAFDHRVRVTALGIGYNTAQAILGGTAPLVATALASSSVTISPSFYLIVCALLSALGARGVIRRRSGASSRGGDVEMKVGSAKTDARREDERVALI